MDWCTEVDLEKVRSEFIRGVTLNVIHEELVENNIVKVQYADFR